MSAAPTAVVPVPCPAAAAEMPASLAAAHALLAQGRLREAALGYAAVLSFSAEEGSAATMAEQARALQGLTLIAHSSGQMGEALRLAQAALERDGCSMVGWTSYASLLAAVGQWQAAEAAFHRALALSAARAEEFLPALTGLGELMLVTSRPAAALACFRRGLALAPGSAVVRYGLGSALALMEEFTAALECFAAVKAMSPQQPEVHFAAGYCAARLGRRELAMREYEEAIRLRPTFAAAWGNLAACLVADGRDYLAVPCFVQALEADPRLLSALLNFGNLLRMRKCFAAARSCYERGLAIEERNVDLRVAMCYLELESSADEDRFARAEGWLENRKTALQQGAAEHPEVANARGIVALARHSASGSGEELETAIRWFRTAAARGHRTADSNEGNALLRVGRVEEAIAAHARSVAIDPLHAGARYNLALSQLRAGRFAEGWENYEARLEFRDVHPRPRRFQQQRWQGESLDGSRLLVYYEQGLGDTLQFARYLPLVAARGARLVVEVQPPLVRLLKPVVERLGGVCIAAGATIPGFDWHVPLLSLPRAFGTTVETVPPPLALEIDAAWAEVGTKYETGGQAVAGSAIGADPCGTSAGLRIGLCWAGNPRYAADRERSTRLESFLPLLRAHPQVEWVALQKGEAAGQVAEVTNRLREERRSSGRQTSVLQSAIRLVDGCSRDADLAETAARMLGLDAVVTTDTVIAHLAGCMELPCWLLLPWQGDWRWMQEREDSPWYRRMRLVRQSRPGDWVGSMERVSRELVLGPFPASLT